MFGDLFKRRPTPAADLGTQRHALSPIIGDRKVLVLTGWAGAGKTSLVKQLVEGLRCQLPQVAGIINEQANSGSINVDRGRLPEGFDSIGMAGCICCIGIRQVKEALTSFHNAGKALIVIEQSPLSNTADLRRAIASHGFSPFVVSVLKPGQIVPRYSAEQVRAADAIVIAGTNTSQMKDTISELTSDLPDRPRQFEIAGIEKPFPTELWELANRTGAPQAGAHDQEKSKLSADASRQRARDVAGFTELQIVPYPLKPGKDLAKKAEDIRAALELLTASDDTRISILRVKGVYAGYDLDITQREGGLVLDLQPRAKKSYASPGNDYLYIRSLDSGLKGCWPSLFRNVGTPICSEAAVSEVVKLYPSKRDLIDQLRKDKTLSGVFEADTLLWELGDTLEYFESISDEERKQQLGMAIVSLTERFLQVRLDVLEILRTNDAKAVCNYDSVVFDALFIGARILVHPQIATLFHADSGFPDLIELANRFWNARPIPMMFEALSKLRDLTINGASDISSNDLAWFKLFADEGIKRREIDASGLEKVAEALSRTASATRNESWISSFDDFRGALGLGSGT